ncbi:PilZ domain-containing protein [Francisella halioticida]|uniref:PilZ domain-containing protein n=1 Tax=Francisella halioticida TaxID=549298 RepID=A0ABM6M190_9GAMM|nr:PilZ domain-containing protein [Francisella halioticida]ASG68648.1 PilZ domain-containing protein [Francisella halioticida]BCD91570.1 PilZ domain-containing protein [Francisella halioticida]
MNSRLDLLKKGAGNSKGKDNEKKPRARVLDEESQESQHRHDDLIEKNNDFESEADHSQSSEYNINTDSDNDDSDENINVIEINLDESQSLDIDPSLLDDDFNEVKETPDTLEEKHEKEHDNFDSDIVEGKISVDYSEKDIKQELEYIFDQREQVNGLHFRIIKDGGMEINTPKILHLGDIIRISITLTELKEQVGCEARIVSIYPKNIRLSNNENSNQYRYIVQFIGPNSSETERILSKYLLGYKIK